MTPMPKLAELIAQYKALGRACHHYPRQGRVSFDGKRSMTESEARAFLLGYLRSPILSEHNVWRGDSQGYEYHRS